MTRYWRSLTLALALIPTLGVASAPAGILAKYIERKREGKTFMRPVKQADPFHGRGAGGSYVPPSLNDRPKRRFSIFGGEPTRFGRPDATTRIGSRSDRSIATDNILR